MNPLHPPDQSEPAAFWMALEARLETIEKRLAEEDVDDTIIRIQVRRLQAARLKLTSALHGARPPHTEKLPWPTKTSPA